ncbi:MAG: ACP S-malonyltransferase [Actinomycetota bacterium]|nr:ACP S-malonyltransferase [Actinomycetota bacterium]
MSLGVLFPGQGSQFVGMGADLFDAMPDLLGDRSDDVLGWSLKSVCLDGPDDELTRTEHAQPALFALSYALWVLVAAEMDADPAAAAGHSLGEYTALAAARVLGYEEALAVVAARGRAMSKAADAEPSGMAALIGADEESALEMTSQRTVAGGRLQVANLNAPGQVVVAGADDDISWLIDNAQELGVRRAIPLNVAGAFHSSFMESAQPEVADALSNADLRPPAFPVWSNTTAAPHEAGEIENTLVAQLVSPVRFSESLVNMAAAGVDTFVHVGPGDVTAGMARRTVKEANVAVISTIEDIQFALVSIGTMA